MEETGEYFVINSDSERKEIIDAAVKIAISKFRDTHSDLTIGDIRIYYFPKATRFSGEVREYALWTAYAYIRIRVAPPLEPEKMGLTDFNVGMIEYKIPFQACAEFLQSKKNTTT